MKYTTVVLATLAFTVACSKVEKVEKNMNSMKSQTEMMSTTTNQMKDTTTIMYQQVRSKEAEDTRNKKFSILKSETEGMGEKIAAAAVYFKSFEYQLWSGEGEFEDEHTREVLLLDAVNEFTKRICDIHDKIKIKKMSPTNTGKKHSAEEAFYALAATMHMNHSFQEDLVESNKSIKAISFYDVVKNALRKDSLGEAMAEYEEVLVSGANKQIMIELIKARVDMLSALGLKNLTDKENMTIGQKIKAGIFKITGGTLGSIDLPETFSAANEPTKKQTIKYLDAANKAKNFLLEVGVEKELEKTLYSAFSKIDLSDAGTASPDGQTPGQESDEKTKIRFLIDGLLK